MHKNQLVFFNTLTRKKEKFNPINPGKIRMYTCGPTVYDYAHIGNFRAFIFEDLVKRWLEYLGFEVFHVMNITDVDDKTIKRSKKQKISFKKFTNFYTKAFFEDLESLNIKLANCYPRATEHIPEMVDLIESLLSKGFAYKSKEKSFYFSIRKFDKYGKLSKIKIDKLKLGKRIKADEYEKDQVQDFVLWKAWVAKDGEVFWETKLGKGRPGWHIECSAMSMKYLGKTFDIHCGGVDNIFPHHENEIAQSEAATGQKFVNYWLHNEHLLVEGCKMSKKMGNYYTLRDLIKKDIDPKAIRLLLLSTHYRAQLNFTFEGLESASRAIERLRNFLRRLQETDGQSCNKEIEKKIEIVKKDFCDALNDDLNVSVMLAVLFDFIREINNLLDENLIRREDAEKIIDVMKGFDSVLGIIGDLDKCSLPKEAEILIKEREEARKNKNWSKSDKIRKKLKNMGIILEDTPHGIRWYLKKS
ncbi:MAG: cysteinyl-tRNA synthetase [miscellaneous Crenarchaeota group-6 archaeon AD8-1]|nr:MAG: cysteinyl-tRNA synthetase [miscellaneous Crenarchaeota group-6 archaeon AD8-1]